MTMKHLRLALFLPCCWLVKSSQAQTLGGETAFLELQQKLEYDVLELRRVVERAYPARCDPSLLRRCHQGNYHDCDSSFPNPICPAEDEFHYVVCGDSCGTRWDYSVSSVRFPPSSSFSNRNHLDPAVVEDICFSKELDEYFVEKREADKPYWEQWGIDNPWMHFGSSSGAFRIYPARPQAASCGDYDPRVRPWYVAGSSGPKNVVLVLDTSGSMEGLRLLYLKQAAARIIDSLTIGDRVAFVTFSNRASEERIEGRALVKVTASTKQLLKERIEGLNASGSTNFYDAFRRVFQVMEDAIPEELVVRCNTAVLFLTDGEMTHPQTTTEQDVLQFVQTGIARLQELLSQPVYLFTYSVSENDDVHEFPKQLACSTGGVWSKLVDDNAIVESLASYTNLFAMGLGEGRNDDFTAWVEPYQFATNGKMGVTVSAPAFDRSVEPPMLIGVVGLDIPMSGLDRALGVDIGSSTTLDRVVQASTAKCPQLDIDKCQLEGFRSIGLAGEEALCHEPNTNCNITAADGPKSLSGKQGQSSCSNQEDLPTNVLANKDYEFATGEERACCNIDASPASDIFGDGTAKDTCVPEGGSNPGFIAGMVTLAVVVVGVLGAGAWWYRRRPRTLKAEVPEVEATPVPEPIVVATNLHVLDPPVNPAADRRKKADSDVSA